MFILVWGDVSKKLWKIQIIFGQKVIIEKRKKLCYDWESTFVNRLIKEKLPQAFMQIGRMENYFRNHTIKVWAN